MSEWSEEIQRQVRESWNSRTIKERENILRCFSLPQSEAVCFWNDLCSDIKNILCQDQSDYLQGRCQEEEQEEVA